MSQRWKVISFDVGGTLIQPRPSVGHVYAASAAAVGLGSVDPAALNFHFRAAWKSRANSNPNSLTFDYSRESWAKLVDECFRGLVITPDSRELFEDAYARFARADAWHIFEDVEATLETLRERGLRLIATSNWDERLVPLLGALNLAHFFEWIAVSREIGYHKPDLRLYEAVTAKLGVRPEEILHIGDSVREDVEGPRAAGWGSLYLSRENPTLNAISNLHELFTVQTV